MFLNAICKDNYAVICISVFYNLLVDCENAFGSCPLFCPSGHNLYDAGITSDLLPYGNKNRMFR
jgi:hypothetical protein